QGRSPRREVSGQAAARARDRARRASWVRRQPEPAQAGARETPRDRRHRPRSPRRPPDAARVRGGLGRNRRRAQEGEEGGEESREAGERRERGKDPGGGILIVSSR